MAKEENKKPTAIVIRADAENQFALLTDKEAGQAIKALFRYVNAGELVQLTSRPVQITFEILRTQVDNYNSKYAERCKRNKAAIEARWRKRKTENIDTNEYERIHTNTNVYDCIQMNTIKVNKSKLNNNQHTINSVCDDNTHAHARTHETEIENNSLFLENCAMALHIDIANVKKLLNQFKVECAAKGTKHLNEHDYRSHFVDWARIQVEKSKRQGTKRTNTDSDINEIWK